MPKFSTRSEGSKRHKSSGSSSFNQESEEASINLNTNVGDNDEDEIEQQDTRFYLQPYDHLTGDQRNAMEEIRAKIKVKYNL
uniref:Uncharacterized protein n=1 Tax=Tanacetum cinerariifolium TaxID=118510 RepID=A0A699V506_TANCI|nr:hypothetical protein [Tanacetum cinerariifolium]